MGLDEGDALGRADGLGDGKSDGLPLGILLVDGLNVGHTVG